MPPKPSLASSFSSSTRPLGHRGQVRGHHVGRRGVHQVADERHRPGEDPGPVGRVVVGGMDDQLDVTGRGGRGPVLPEGVAAEQPAERHRLGLVRLTGGERDGDPLDPSLRSQGGGGQIAGGRPGGAAQPLQVGLAIGGRAGLRAQADGADHRGRHLTACRDLGEFFRLTCSAERSERGHQVDFIGTQRENRAVLALEHAGDESVRIGCGRR
jgi:hypothetical protein